MAKSLGIFKKKADEEEDRPEAKGPTAKSSRDEPKGKGALSDAFDELEAESVSESPRLFRQSDRPEDELIQFLDEKPKVTMAEPGPPALDPVRTKIVEPQVRKEQALRVPVKLSGSPAPAPSEPVKPPQAATKAPEAREEHSPSLQAMSRKAEAEEDSIYEMIKSQTFARVKPQAVQRPLMRTERPRAAQVQKRVLRAPAPMPEPRLKPPESVVAKVVEAPKQKVEPAQVQTKRKFTAGAPILTQVKHDYLTLTLLMRWVEFLFERVVRDKLSLVLDYYVEVGWITEEVRSEVMAYARGEMQDVTKYTPHEEEISDESPEFKGTSVAVYKKVDDWRLSADDHLKSLLFITKMAGVEVDKDSLNSLEQSIKRFKENLEGYYGV